MKRKNKPHIRGLWFLLFLLITLGIGYGLVDYTQFTPKALAVNKLPGVIGFKDIGSFMRTPSEEYSWSSNPRRLASEDKKNFMSNNLWELEQVPWPQNQMTKYNYPEYPIFDWDFPDFPDWGWPGDPWDQPGDPAQAAFFVCSAAQWPGSIECGQCLTWLVSGGDEVKNAKVTGDAALSVNVAFNWITLCARETTSEHPVEGTYIHLSFELHRPEFGGLPALCEKDIYVECCQNEYDIELLVSDDTIDRSDINDLRLENVAEENLHTPYDWTVTGTGFWFEKTETQSPTEYNQLNSDSDACECARIKVTDQCGNITEDCIIMDDVTDTFTGANGADPDTCYWAKGGTPALTGTGYCRFNLGDSITSNYNISGDHSFSVNFKMNSGAKVHTWAFFLAGYIDGSNYWHVSYRAHDIGGGGGGDPKYYYIIGKRIAGVYSQVYISAGSDVLNTGNQTFTISRSGGNVTLTCPGSSQTTAFPSGDVEVRIVAFYTVAMQADVNTYTLTSGTVIWPNCSDCP